MTCFIKTKSRCRHTILRKQTLPRYSIGLTPVTLTGITTYEGTPLDEVIIAFKSDESVVGNTADDITVTSEADGSYEVQIIPGHYNVSLKKVMR